MDKPDFCCVGNFPVLIPYQDLENMLEIARNLDHYKQSLAHANDQLAALRMQYGELLEKVREMGKMI